MSFKLFGAFFIALAIVSFCDAQGIDQVRPLATPWNQFVPNTNLFTTGWAYMGNGQGNDFSYMISDGNSQANILPSQTFVLFEVEPSTIFFTVIDNFPFCLMTVRDLPRARLRSVIDAGPVWNTTVAAFVPNEGRGVRLTPSEYNAVAAKDSRIDDLCRGYIIDTEGVTALAKPGAISSYVEYYLPLESFNVTVYEEDQIRNDATPWNQFVPNTNLFTTGWAYMDDDISYIISDGNTAANILSSQTFILFEEDPSSIFFTRIGSHPFCLMTERDLPKADLRTAIDAAPVWNSTVAAFVPIEGRGVRLTQSEYNLLVAKDRRIDDLCRGYVVDTEGVTELANPEAASIFVEYYLPFESFNVTIYKNDEDRSNNSGARSVPGFITLAVAITLLKCIFTQSE